MKRNTILLLTVLAVAIGLFWGYHYYVSITKDVTGPVIAVEEGILEISVKDASDVLLRGITAVDDVDGDVTDSLLVESIYGISDDNVTTVTYAAFDSSGNVSKLERQVRYVDYESPKFELYGSLTFAAGSGFDLLDYVGAVDVLEGDIRRRVHATLISDTRSVSNVGSHQVQFQVINELGDCAEVVLPVEVYDPEWYTASVELSDYLIYLNRGASFDSGRYLKSFVVRGEAIDVDRTIPSDISCSITGKVNTQVPGVYAVTYTLAQNVNFMTYTGQAVLIVIVE